MQEILLFGISPLSERIAYYIEHGRSVKNFSVKGFIIDDEYFSEDNFANKKIYRYSEAKENFSENVPVIICIGYKNMNENRKNIFHRLQADGWTIESFISTAAVIDTDSIGVGNIFIENSRIGISCEIGNANIFDSSYLGHHSAVGDFNFFCNNSTTGGKIKIGDCCFFGMNSTVRNGVEIHDKTLIGAGCYINHSTDKPGLAYAAPKPIYLGRSDLAEMLWNNPGGGIVLTRIINL